MIGSGKQRFKRKDELLNQEITIKRNEFIVQLKLKMSFGENLGILNPK